MENLEVKNEETKECSRCGVSQPLSSFNPRVKGSPKLRSNCKKCLSCYRKSNSKRIKDYAETYKERRKELYWLKHDHYINYKRNYKLNNSDVLKQRNLLYRAMNRGTINANKMVYIASKINATPLWLSKEHKLQIRAIYDKSVHLSNETGVSHHVDHIVPLKGKNVCGLHVPWNLQILTAFENMTKGNKL